MLQILNIVLGTLLISAFGRVHEIEENGIINEAILLQLLAKESCKFEVDCLKKEKEEEDQEEEEEEEEE